MVKNGKNNLRSALCEGYRSSEVRSVFVESDNGGLRSLTPGQSTSQHIFKTKSLATSTKHTGMLNLLPNELHLNKGKTVGTFVISNSSEGVQPGK